MEFKDFEMDGSVLGVTTEGVAEAINWLSGKTGLATESILYAFKSVSPERRTDMVVRALVKMVQEKEEQEGEELPCGCGASHAEAETEPIPTDDEKEDALGSALVEVSNLVDDLRDGLFIMGFASHLKLANAIAKRLDKVEGLLAFVVS